DNRKNINYSKKYIYIRCKGKEETTKIFFHPMLTASKNPEPISIE
ncbi:17361_t:CDS:1, partial [Cetraspora pellucida]